MYRKCLYLLCPIENEEAYKNIFKTAEVLKKGSVGYDTSAILLPELFYSLMQPLGIIDDLKRPHMRRQQPLIKRCCKTLVNQ